MCPIFLKSLFVCLKWQTFRSSAASHSAHFCGLHKFLSRENILNASDNPACALGEISTIGTQCNVNSPSLTALLGFQTFRIDSPSQSHTWRWKISISSSTSEPRWILAHLHRKIINPTIAAAGFHHQVRDTTSNFKIFRFLYCFTQVRLYPVRSTGVASGGLDCFNIRSDFLSLC